MFPGTTFPVLWTLDTGSLNFLNLEFHRISVARPNFSDAARRYSHLSASLEIVLPDLAHDDTDEPGLGRSDGDYREGAFVESEDAVPGLFEFSNRSAPGIHEPPPKGFIFHGLHHVFADGQEDDPAELENLVMGHDDRPHPAAAELHDGQVVIRDEGPDLGP